MLKGTENGRRRKEMAKKFEGSILVLILLVLFCWPAAIIYYLMKREEVAPIDAQAPQYQQPPPQ